MNNVIRTFEDGSELTTKQLVGAVVAGMIVGTGWTLGRSALSNRKYKKARRELQIRNRLTEVIDVSCH